MNGNKKITVEDIKELNRKLNELGIPKREYPSESYIDKVLKIEKKILKLCVNKK